MITLDATAVRPQVQESLKEQFLRSRRRSQDLCAPLHTEDYIPQPVYFASPPKWHLSHTSWFYEEMVLKKYVDGYTEFDPIYNYLFNSYYQSAGARLQREHRGATTRPSVAEVLKYRDHVDREMVKLIESSNDRELFDLIILGINHEEQHQELLITDLKHTFSYNPTYPIYKEGYDLTAQTNTASGWHTVDAGVYEIAMMVLSFAMTMNWEGIKYICSLTRFAKTSSPMGSIWNSWRMAVIQTLSRGSMKAGRGYKKKLSKRHSTGSRSKTTGINIPLQDLSG